MTELIRYFFAVGVSVLRLRCKGWPLATLDWAATSCYACMRAATPVCSPTSNIPGRPYSTLCLCHQVASFVSADVRATIQLLARLASSLL